MDKYWIWLSQIKGIGPITQKKLIKKFKSPLAVYQASKEELISAANLGQSAAETIKNSQSLIKAEKILDKLAKLEADLLTYDNPLYPQKVKEIPEMPAVLYYNGNIKAESMGAAIVGARRCTNYGKEVTKEAAAFLAKNSIPVISGLAKGIDGYAHTACLKAGGYTLAFLGCGIDICYPKEHQELMDKIKNCGAVISQFPHGTKVSPRNFPQRNLLIAAWSHKVLIVEATEKSGSLLTAQYAKEYKRQVLAVPNSIFVKEGRGTNKLIAAGSEIYLSPNQLLVKRIGNNFCKPIENNDKDFLPKDITIPKKTKTKLPNKTDYNLQNAGLNPLELEILNLLSEYPKTIEQLSVLLPEIDSLLEVISTMELEGKIETIPGGKIRRRNNVVIR